MDIRLKDLTHVTQRAFMTGKWDKCEKLGRRQEILLERIFNDIRDGRLDSFYQVSDKHFYAYHRSTKEDGALQYSHAWLHNGEFIPTNDVQLHSIAELLREGLPSGMWHTRKNGGIYGQNRNEEHALPS